MSDNQKIHLHPNILLWPNKKNQTQEHSAPHPLPSPPKKKNMEFDLSTDVQNRGAALLKTIPSSMLPLNPDDETKDYRYLNKLHPELEKAVDRRVNQGRADIFSCACRLTYPLAALTVDKKKCTSRALLKLNEIFVRLRLWPSIVKKRRLAFLCEAPGSYAQCVIGRILHVHPDAKLSTFLHSAETARGHPAFNDKLLTRIKERAEETIVMHANILEPLERHKILEACSGQYDMVTADGGSDSRVPLDRSVLAGAQLLTALQMLRPGGLLVLKLLDLSSREACWPLLATCNLLFAKVTLVKPKASRCANTEVFLIAEVFTGIEKDRVTSFEVWLLHVAVHGETGVSPFPMTREFRTLCDMAYRTFEITREKSLKQALEVTKHIIKRSPLAYHSDLQPLERTCLQNPVLKNLADTHRCDFPIIGAQAIMSSKNLVDLLASLQDLH
jgi:23S rRNA U2552 (ribose-2'-O)-methylase RlmE/FtsJ